ncbi:HAD family hydrolase [Thermoactinomyces mirandus]|uniref:HAD family hydrolase n=1 Tax=Thermoactinomyces mirandus TaxID=2756294 RepID=A0A7W2AR27_9BACL|nr:HAD family hydrolase [Thermoactinomyces mirandus]MBA4601882.1 HAD family hydrolase [Thermoactinomyces mirandus]
MGILPYPFLVSDIDGTLLDDKQQILQDNKDKIALFQKLGGLFTLATGRTYLEAKQYIEQLNIQIPVILCNGATLFDPVSGEIVPVRTVNREVIIRMLNELKTFLSDQVDVFVYGLDKVYGEKVGPFARASLGDDFRVELIPSFANLPESPYLKIILAAEKEEMNRILDRFEQLKHFPFDFFLSSDSYFEILPSGVSKGNALVQVLKSINIKAHQVAAIGDHCNDLSMLSQAGLPAAVANAHPLVLKQASVHVPSHNQAGVAYFIRKHLLPQTVRAYL